MMEMPDEYRIEFISVDGRTAVRSIWGLDNALHFAHDMARRVPDVKHCAVVNTRTAHTIPVTIPARNA